MASGSRLRRSPLRSGAESATLPAVQGPVFVEEEAVRFSKEEGDLPDPGQEALHREVMPGSSRNVASLAAKRKTKFKDEYTTEFPSIKRGRFDYEAECQLCHCYFSISHGGRSDIRDHVGTRKHKNALRFASSTVEPTPSFKANKSDGRKVAAAEATFAFHSVRHHHSYNSTTCTSKLFSELFSDSKIARTFSSAKTKTKAVVHNVISPAIQDELKANLSRCDFIGLSTDASSHKYPKIFPVLVQYFDKTEGLQSKLLALGECAKEDSETISEFVHEVVKRNNLSGKISSFGGDNTNTNFGGPARKGEGNVFTQLKCKLGGPMVGVGCPAHILHNSLQAGADGLSVDVQTLLGKVYNYFSVYTVRVAPLMEYCEFVSETGEDFLNHAKTRWSSLLPAIEKFLQQFEPLKSYFMSLDNCPALLKSFFSSEVGEAYFWFIKAQVSLFQRAIGKMEKKEISVNEVRAVLLDVVDTLKQRRGSGFLSIKVKDMLANLPQSQSVTFECMSFYDAATNYLLNWSESLCELKHFDWILLQRSVAWDEVECTFRWLADNSHCKLNESVLFDQVVNLNSFVAANNSKEDFSRLLANKKWVMFFRSCASEEQFSELLKIVQFYFSLPGHNANVERVFSLMGAHWTEERNRLGLSSISAILDIQYNMADVTCSDFHKWMSSEKMSKYLGTVQSSQKYDWFRNTSALKEK